MLSKEIQRLSSAERILLVEEIWDSIASRKIAARKEEIEYVKTRLSKIESGKSKVKSWDKVKAELGD